MHAMLRQRVLRRGLRALWEHFKVRGQIPPPPSAFTICAPPALRATEQQQLFWATTTTTLALSNSQSTSRATRRPIASERLKLHSQVPQEEARAVLVVFVVGGGAHTFSVVVSSLGLFEQPEFCNHGDGGSFY